MTTATNAGIQRYTGGLTCPNCGGCNEDPRGAGSRCFGYLSSDGRYAHCTREDAAGSLPPHPKSGTYPHKLNGDCSCGRTHGPEIARETKSGRAKGGGRANGRADGRTNGKPKGPPFAESGRPYSERREASYYYLDADCLPVLRVDRLRDPKDFRQFKPDGTTFSGAVRWAPGGTAAIPKIPYHLNEIAAADSGAVVFHPEGEKDADRLRSLGLLATCVPGGAEAAGRKGVPEVAKHLAGRNVVVLADNDDVGRSFAELVAASLVSAVATSVKVIHFPETPPKGDVSDWLDAGGTVEKLMARVEASPPWTPGDGGGIGGGVGGGEVAEDATPDGERKSIKADDDPHRLVRLFLSDNFDHDDGRTLVYHRGEFHRWDGAKYHTYKDVTVDLVAAIEQEFDRLNVALVGRIVERSIEAGVPVPLPDDLPRAAKVTTSILRNAMQALQSEVCLESDMDAPAWIDVDPGVELPPPDSILPAANGLVDLETLHVLPPTPRFYCPFAVPFAFDADAPSPRRWLRFLEELWPGDPASVRELQKWFGYLTSIDKSQEKALLIQGPKRCGKGTLIAVLETMLGHANVATTTLGDLSGRFGLWPLMGKAAAIIPDARFGAAENDGMNLTERLLSITSRDPVLVDMKNKEPIKARLPTRLVVFTNVLPNLREDSGALASRFMLLKITQTFYGREDPDLAANLIGEIGGVLRWAIDGRRMLRDDGRFLMPATATEMEKSFEELASPVMAFATECLEIIEPDERSADKLAPFRDIHLSYQWWCRITNRRPSNDNIFSRNLGAAFHRIKLERPRIKDENGDELPRIRRCRGVALNTEGHAMRRAQEDYLEKQRAGPHGPRYGPH